MGNYTESDLKALETLVRSRGYKILVERMTTALELKRRALEIQADAQSIHRAQGYIEAMRAALSLPESVAAEIKKSHPSS